MTAWWYSLTILEQIFAAVAFAATAVLIIQTVLLLFSVGGGHEDFDSSHDLDHDFDHDFDHDISDGHGIDHDFDHDHDCEHSHGQHDSGLRIFTVRGFVTFFCIFGWAGLAMLRQGVNTAVSITSATVLGVIFMVIVAVCFAMFFKLQANGNVEAKEAVGVSGRVYIPIPPGRSGCGKITASVAGRFSEYDAVTDGEEKIPTGAAVTVVAVTGEDTLVVVKK